MGHEDSLSRQIASRGVGSVSKPSAVVGIRYPDVQSEMAVSGRARLADREAFRWCGLLGYMLRKPVAWVYVVERHASGLWHAHVLVAGAGVPAVKGVAAAWSTRNGRVHVRGVDNRRRAVLYTTKQA